MNVLLIGPRGCGKTSVGRRLAADRGLHFVDLDDRALAAFDIAKRCQFVPAEHFASDGGKCRQQSRFGACQPKGLSVHRHNLSRRIVFRTAETNAFGLRFGIL